MNIFEAYDNVKNIGEKVCPPDWGSLPRPKWIRWYEDSKCWLDNNGDRYLPSTGCDDYEIWQPTYTNEEAFYKLKHGRTIQKEGHMPIRKIPGGFIVYKEGMPVPDTLLIEMFLLPGEWTEV